MDYRLHQGDCLETMRDMPDGCVDLTVTSPPYDGLRTYNGYSFDFENIARELYRITKPGGVVVWVVGDATVKGSETGTSFRQALFFKDVCGFNLHDTMIYEKDSMSFPNPARYHQIFEFMFVLSKGKPKAINIIKDRKNLWANGRKHIKGTYRDADGQVKQHNKQNLLQEYGARNNIWRIPGGCNKSTLDKEAFKHPAIFPEALARDHILSWSNEGDTVFDPFTGSGTTGKMAVLHGRKFIGCEISAEYLEIAERRIQKAAAHPEPPRQPALL